MPPVIPDVTQGLGGSLAIIIPIEGQIAYIRRRAVVNLELGFGAGCRTAGIAFRVGVVVRAGFGLKCGDKDVFNAVNAVLEVVVS
jgi:hypothetical protein